MKHIINALLVLAAFSFGAAAFAQSGWTQSEPRSSTFYQNKDSGKWTGGGECGGRLEGCDVLAQTVCREIWYVRAVKIVPRPGTGTERIISCSNKDKSAPSAASTPEATSFIENCPYTSVAKLVSDCACIARTLQTLPSVPPGSPPEDKPTKRAAEACTLNRDALARNMTESIHASGVGGGMAEHAECIGHRFAAAYSADPSFNLPYIERLRRNAFHECSGKAVSTTSSKPASSAATLPKAATTAGTGSGAVRQESCLALRERLAAARQKGNQFAIKALEVTVRQAGCGR